LISKNEANFNEIFQFLEPTECTPYCDALSTVFPATSEAVSQKRGNFLSSISNFAGKGRTTRDDQENWLINFTKYQALSIKA
jgi:hypothetical protein